MMGARNHGIEHSMYCPDVVSLKQFYASPVGELACSCIARRVRALWPEAEGETTLGLGYATPYFTAECGKRSLTVAAMPALQGALYWPMAEKNRALLADESKLPFADNAFNRVLLVHALEHGNRPDAIMQEIWRVLVPGGRMLAIVPNRRGAWARSHRSPFGSGWPFSAGQIRQLAAENGLTFTRLDGALFMPPFYMHWLRKALPWLEAAGGFVCPLLGGVLLIEAEKQIYAALKEPVWARGRAVMSPVAQPAFSP